MFKAVLTLAVLFSFQSFAAGKTAKAQTRPVAKKQFAAPNQDARATEVNTNMGWPSPKSELQETPAQVKAKWNGFTPEKRDEAPARKTASAQETKKSKTSAKK